MAATRSRSTRRAAARRLPEHAPPSGAAAPLISRGPETSDEYLVRIAALVSRSGTHVYFDASFLIWMVKLGKPARSQFLAWVAAEQRARFHVPLWTAHEFFKHQVNETVLKEFGSELGRFDKATLRLFEKIRSYCCDELFGFPNGGSMFVDEFKRTVQPLRTMLRLAQDRGKDEIGTANAEVAAFVDAHLLPGPLREVVEGIEADESVRLRGVIPPGFNDNHKRGQNRQAPSEGRDEPSGDNAFGDLVFWREILRHAAEANAGALLIATGDRKNDWFVNYYGNASVSEEMRRRVTSPRPVPMPHPLLVREAFDRRAGELALIDPVYMASLMQKGGLQYAAFASAAIDIHLPQVARRNLEAQIWAARMGQTARMATSGGTARNSPETGGAEARAEEAVEPAAQSFVDRDALMASTRDLSHAASSFIDEFASADVAARVELMPRVEWTELEAWTAMDLVVLGRTIAVAAEGGDVSAERFISDLRDHAAVLSPAVAEPVYLGALASLYFDAAMNRRPASGSPIVHVLLDAVTLPAFAKSTEVLGAALSEGGAPPLFLPGSSAGPLELEVVVQAAADNQSVADFVAIKLFGRDLTTDLQTDEALRFGSLLQSASHDFKLGALADVVMRFHLLPRQLISMSADAAKKVRVAQFAGVEIEP